MDFFGMDLSISGNFSNFGFSWQLSSPPGAKQAKILDWIHSFQAISSNFGFGWQLSSPQGQTVKNLNWIYSFQAISSNFGFSWQLSLQLENSELLFWIYPFHAISSNFALPGRKAPFS